MSVLFVQCLVQLVTLLVNHAKDVIWVSFDRTSKESKTFSNLSSM